MDANVLKDRLKHAYTWWDGPGLNMMLGKKLPDGSQVFMVRTSTAKPEAALTEEANFICLQLSAERLGALVEALTGEG